MQTNQPEGFFSRLLSGIKSILFKKRQTNNTIMEQQQENNMLEIVLCEHTVDTHKLKRSFVVPGNITVTRGEDVTWKAGETDIVMFFPDERVFNTDKIVVKAGESKTMTVNENIDTGIYPYGVYTAAINDFAEGNSTPRMTIK